MKTDCNINFSAAHRFMIVSGSVVWDADDLETAARFATQRATEFPGIPVVVYEYKTAFLYPPEEPGQ